MGLGHTILYQGTVRSCFLFAILLISQSRFFCCNRSAYCILTQYILRSVIPGCSTIQGDNISALSQETTCNIFTHSLTHSGSFAGSHVKEAAFSFSFCFLGFFGTYLEEYACNDALHGWPVLDSMLVVDDLNQSKTHL